MQLIIFSGVQVSGKSSFYLLNVHHSHLRINLEMLKTRHRENIIYEAFLANILEQNNQRTVKNPYS